MFKRFTTFSAKLKLMHEHQPSPKLPSQSQEIIGRASFACLAVLAFLYWYAGPAVRELDVWWAQWLVYGLIPILVTFLLLHRSRWHQGTKELTRTCSLFLLACVILVGVYFVIGAMLAVGAYSLSSLQPHVAGR